MKIRQLLVQALIQFQVLLEETTVKYFDTHGIPSIVVADGPGGIRIKQEYEATDVTTGEKETDYQYCTAWPVSVLRGQTWNTELLEEVGRAFARALKEMGITVVFRTKFKYS